MAAGSVRSRYVTPPCLPRRASSPPSLWPPVAGRRLVELDPTAPANPDLTVIAEEIHFDQKEYSVANGEVRVAYPNQGTQTHTLIVQDSKGDDIAPKLRSGRARRGRRLPAGDGHLHAVCDITGHRAAGMVASLDGHALRKISESSQ